MSEHHFQIGNSGDEDEEQQQQSKSSPSVEDSQSTNSNHKMKRFDDEKLTKLNDHWLQLDEEIRGFETKHKVYVKQLDEVEALKTQYRMEFDRYKKKITQLQTTVEQLKKTYSKKGEKIRIWRQRIEGSFFCRRGEEESF